MARALGIACPTCRAEAGHQCATQGGVPCRDRLLATEPVDDRPWRERTLTSIVAELERKRRP